jgi:hypothetical protein
MMYAQIRDTARPWQGPLSACATWHGLRRPPAGGLLAYARNCLHIGLLGPAPTITAGRFIDPSTSEHLGKLDEPAPPPGNGQADE